MGSGSDYLVASLVEERGTHTGTTVAVRLSNELVGLLSDQLYHSPLKAIEELVVNAFDADASECRVSVPENQNSRDAFVAVFDDGHGMSADGLTDLWTVGRSKKRLPEDQGGPKSNRAQIGKFGIGKLATHAVARRVTYLSRLCGSVRAVTVDFNQFQTNPDGSSNPILLPVREVPLELGKADSRISLACQRLGTDSDVLFGGKLDNWTLVFLEELRSDRPIQLGRLKWVLSTAMPLRPDFLLYLNGEKVVSSKADKGTMFSFSVSELSESRLKELSESSEEEWSRRGEVVACKTLPQGVSGSIHVWNTPLDVGKSNELGRSFGFFVYVRGRLINEGDALFGFRPLSYKTFYRMQAFLNADDLDADVTAPREGVAGSERTRVFRQLLLAIFNEARMRHVAIEEKQDEEIKRKKEHEREYVHPRLVEHAVADALSEISFLPGESSGAEADNSWFFLSVPPKESIADLVTALYTEPRSHFKYRYVSGGRNSRLVKFNPQERTFEINEDHVFALAHADDDRSKRLMEDMVTAEVLLEVYLREAGIQPEVTGQVLERRDSLLKSLAQDHLFSLEAIAGLLQDASADEHELEVQLVSAARALGFVAKHVSGSDQPDGLAEFNDYASGPVKITLEAKSSVGTPSLSALDFAGLRRHVSDHDARGCLLVAPSYPGASREDAAAAARSANELKISCWSVSDLSRVVANAEKRNFSARTVLEIVLSKFAPDDVAEAIEDLFEQPKWNMQQLYQAIMQALWDLDGRLPDAIRTLGLIAGEVSRAAEFQGVKKGDIDKATVELANASKGLIVVSNENVYINGSLEEIGRRLVHVLGQGFHPRRTGKFRHD